MASDGAILAGFRGARAPARAFSLLELMVVILLLGVLASMIVPQFGGTYEDALLRAAARDLVAVLTLAYSQAVTTGRVHRVRLDLEEGRFFVEARAGSEGPRFAPLVSVPGSAGRLNPRMRVEVSMPDRPARHPGGPGTEEPCAIAFRPDGTADPCEVRIEDRAGFVVLVQVDPTTSRIRALDAEREVRS